MSKEGGGPKPPEKKAEARPMTRARRNAALLTEYNERMHRLAMLRRRIELANAGVHAFEAGKIGEAVKNYHSYLRILEDWKGVPEGKLTPSLFDIKLDVAELLLISGVYWDLSRLYDRTKSADKMREFNHFLEKYVLFSRGMPFQHVCLETLRKYISNDKPLHKVEFKNAYKTLGGSPYCFVATSLMDVSDDRTLPRLRRFRDERLARTERGRAFIRWYYQHGPVIARAVDRAPKPIRALLGKTLDWTAWAISP